MNNKKLKTSKVIIGLYVCTGIVSVYALYAIFNSITYLRNYFKTYGSSIGEHFGDALSYILNQSLSYIVFAVLLFAAAAVPVSYTHLGWALANDASCERNPG